MILLLLPLFIFVSPSLFSPPSPPPSFHYRYFAIVYPLESKIQQSKSRTIKILVAVWIFPLLGASPNLFFQSRVLESTLSSNYGTISRLHCADTFSPEFRKFYFTFLFVFFYFIPLTFIAWTCCRITQCLLKSTQLCRESS